MVLRDTLLIFGRTVILMLGVVILPLWVDLKLRSIFKRLYSASELNLFSDIFKLFRKETLVSGDAPWALFLALPGLVFIFSCLLLILSIDVFAWRPLFSVDIISLFLLILAPFLLQGLSAVVSQNPRSIIQASIFYRMLVFVLIPLMISMVQPLIKHAGGFKITTILAAQVISGPTIASLSGVLSFVIFIFVSASILRMFPCLRDNTVSGNTISMEFSGPLLSLMIMSSWILRGSLALIALALYCWGSSSFLQVFFKYLAIVVLGWFISILMDIIPPEKNKIYFKILSILSAVVVLLNIFAI